ncbi:MAG: hypothetical protein LBF63_01780, partial [Treponema sp.]|nr:hypothetical protein [Treponema sp.]
MADIWEKQDDPGKPGPFTPSKIFENAEENYNSLRKWREENKDRYGIELSNEGFMAMNLLSQYAADDEEYVSNMYRFAAARKLSETRGLPFEYAFVNLDSLMESQYPNIKGEKSWFKAVGDSFALGTNTGIMAEKAWELRFARTPEERNRIWAEIMRLSEENLNFKDGVTRDMFTEGLKAFGESWSFMAKGAAGSFLGGLIHPAVGFIASGAMSARDMIGLEYISLLEQGVDDETAWKTAVASGSIQGVFEAISDPLSVIPGKGLGQFIFKRLHFAGKIGAFARAVGAEMIDVAFEGATEYAQEGVSQGFTERAKQATEKKARETVAQGDTAALEQAAEDLATSA